MGKGGSFAAEPAGSKPQSPPPPFLPPDDRVRKSLDGQQIKIQTFLFALFITFALILFLGRLRSRGGGKRKFVSSKLFIITGYLISYVPGLMNGKDKTNDIYVFWMAFVAYLAAVINEISAYSMGDNEDRKKRLVIDYFVVWPLILNSIYRSLAIPEIIVPVMIIFWVIVLKLRERSTALLYSTKSSHGLSRATQIVSDFAKNPKESFSVLLGFIEARKMVAKRLKEPRLIQVDLNTLSSEFVTLDQVYDIVSKEQDKKLNLTKNTGEKLKDTCFSFTMFSLLLTKIAGFDKNAKIFDGLNSFPWNSSWEKRERKEGGKFKREEDILPYHSFKLVETELDFLYDYLFTNYYAIYDRGIWKKIRDALVISLFFSLSVPLLIEYHSERHNPVYVLIFGQVLDNGFTRFVISTILLVEFTQIGIFLTSKWAKVMYTCSYILNKPPWPFSKSCQRRFLTSLIYIAFLVPRPKIPTCGFSKLKARREIGQYEILKCYNLIPCRVWTLKCWIGSYFEIPEIGHKASKKEVLKDHIKERIISKINTCLQVRDGIFTNGIFPFQNNPDVLEIIQTYATVGERMSQARIILVWHIATSMLEEGLNPEDKIVDSDVATVFSKYCASLVAFNPQFLPGHVYTARCEFNKAIQELTNEAYEVDQEDDIEDLQGFNVESSIVNQGRRLHKKLKEQDNYWQILAEFWMEKLMFFALSDSSEAIDAHLDNLCIGGEFITHLWALVTHAGCKASTT